MSERWHDLGPVDDLREPQLRQLVIGRTVVALSYAEGAFGAVSGRCNHSGGPLGGGRLEGDYIVCPWHYWKFHRLTGSGEPGFEEDQVTRYRLEEREGHLWIDLEPVARRHVKPHKRYELAREPRREAGPVRVVGISTTAMTRDEPRYSTSEALLEVALEHAAQGGAETRLVRLRDLSFRACEGFYSKASQACTWPCSITQMDRSDELDQVYEALVHWADVALVATPIRWGAGSSLYYKMVERMNCIQNQITIRDKVLIRDKVAAFVVTGGQDGIQAVAGQMLGFFGEIGFVFPPFPYVAHSRGWTAEDMENNVAFVRQSEELRDGARALADRAVELASRLLAESMSSARIVRGGRKAHRPA